MNQYTPVSGFIRGPLFCYQSVLDTYPFRCHALSLIFMLHLSRPCNATFLLLAKLLFSDQRSELIGELRISIQVGGIGVSIVVCTDSSLS